MELMRLTSAVLLFVLAGYVLIRLVDARNSSGLKGVSLLGASFMLGTGAVTLQMFIYSLSSISFGVFIISTPWIALGAATLFLRPQDGANAVKPAADKTGAVEAALLFVIVSQVAYAFIYSLSMPLSGWDAWFIWFLKARVFFIDKGVSAVFLTDPLYSQAHPDYPLMVPLAVSWIYTAAGRAYEQFGKVIYPLQFASMLIVFNYAAGRVSDKRTGLLFTALLSLTPFLLAHAGGLPVKIGGLYTGDFTGYSDLALSAYFMAGGAFLFLYMKEGVRAHLVLASLMFAVSAWTKNEGITFAGFSFLLLIVFLVVERRSSARDIVYFLIPLFVFVLPWTVYKSAHGLTSEYVGNLSLSVFTGNLGRLAAIIPTALKFMFTQVALLNFAWWAYLASTLLNFRNAGAVRLLTLHALLLLQLGAYIFVYIITPVDINWHLLTSLDRLILQLLPLGMFITAVNFSMLLKNGDQQRSYEKA